VTWTIEFTKISQEDARKIAEIGLKPKVERLLEILETDPYQSPPPCKRLSGDLAGYYSRRISIKHRLVYEVIERERTVKVLRMWSHYE